MGNKFDFPPVTREDGSVVSPDEIQKESDQADFLPFKYEGKNFSVAVRRSQIPTDPVLRFRAAQAKLQSQSGLLDDPETLEEITRITDSVQGLSDADIDVVLTPEEKSKLQAFNLRFGVGQVQSAPELWPLKLNIVVPAIAGWNLPTHNPTLDTFKNNHELADAVVPVVWAWWERPNPSLEDSEPDGQTTPTPSTHDSSSGSSAMETTESASLSTHST
jgi:hypothetical protein